MEFITICPRPRPPLLQVRGHPPPWPLCHACSGQAGQGGSGHAGQGGSTASGAGRSSTGGGGGSGASGGGRVKGRGVGG